MFQLENKTNWGIKRENMKRTLQLQLVLSLWASLALMPIYGQSCSDAGVDTSVCGFSIQLTGTPAPGIWHYDCREDKAAVTIFNTNGKAFITVSKCGKYRFSYKADSCSNTDEVNVEFYDPATSTTDIQYEIGLDYRSVECHESTADTCGNRRRIKGKHPPLPQWDFLLSGLCTVNFTSLAIAGYDSMTCLATGINLKPETLSGRETRHWAPTQNVLVRMNQDGSIDQNIFLSFLQILTNSLENQLRDSCGISSTCDTYSNLCVDTIYDTIPVYVPVRTGGHWTFIGQAGAVGLDTSNEVIINSKTYHLYVRPSAKYYGPDDITFEIWGDNNGKITAIDTALQADVYWTEEWIYDTLQRVVPRYVRDDQCVNCGYIDHIYGAIHIPPLPFVHCNTLLLHFTPLPPITLPKDTAICNGDFLVLDAGADFTSYKWDNGIHSRYRTVLDSGEYSVTVTAPNGCADSVITHIKIAASPSIDIIFADSVSSICAGDEIALTVPEVPKSTIEWSNGDTGRIIRFPAKNYNIYGVTVRDSNGCIAQDTFVFVGQNANITINAGPDLVLNCSERQLQPVVDTMTLALMDDFNWSGPGIDSMEALDSFPVIDTAGRFILAVLDTSTGCRARDTILVKEDTLPPKALSFDMKVLNCVRDSIIFDLRDSFPANHDLSWTGPGIDSQNIHSRYLVLKDSGQYLLEVCNARNKCCTSSEFSVKANHFMPIALAGPDKTLSCMVQSVLIGDTASVLSSSTRIVWKGPGIIPPSDSIVVSVNKGGVYILNLTDTLSQCSDKDTVQIMASDVVPVADAGADAVLSCDTPTVMLDGSNSVYAHSAVLKWSGPDIQSDHASDEKPVVSKPGIYILTIRDSISGCISMDTVSVTGSVNIPIIDAGKDKIITCVIPATTLQGLIRNPSTSQKILWSGPGVTAPNRTRMQPEVSLEGKYYFTVTDTISGCSATDSVEVIGLFNPAKVDIVGDSIINCVKKSVTLKGNIKDLHPKASFEWSGPDITDANKNNLTVDVKTGGLYVLMTEYPNAICNRSDTILVVTDTLPPTFSIVDSAVIDCKTNKAILEIVPGDTSDFKRIAWSSKHGYMYEMVPWKISVTQADTINLFVLGKNLCSKGKTIVVKDWDRFNIHLEAKNSCPHDSTGQILIHSVPKRRGPYEYSLDSISYLQDSIFSGVRYGKYTVFVKDSAGCVVSEEISIDSFPSVRFGLQTEASCDQPPTGRIIFDPAGNSGVISRYILQSPTDSMSNRTGVFDSLPGAISYRAYVLDTNGCFTIKEIFLEEVENFTLTALDTIFFCDEPYLVLDATEDDIPANVRFNWGTSNDTLATKTVPAQAFEYTVVISNACHTGEKTFIILPAAIDIDTIGKLPLAFTPNGDHVNDDFGLIVSDFGKQQIASYELRIFNRWGNIIFKSDDIQKRWDGSFNGLEQASGVYLFTLTYSINGCGDNPVQRKSFKGNITLIR